jgi:hypothetical protein
VLGVRHAVLRLVPGVSRVVVARICHAIVWLRCVGVSRIVRVR